MTIARRLDAVIDFALGRSIVGCVMLVHENGRSVYARAAGFADRETARSVKIDTIFRLSSVTKPIVATAALKMMEQGLLKLDDPVTRFLPWFRPRNSGVDVPVMTIRQLMCHTCGLTYDVPADISPGLSGPIITLEENLRRLSEIPLAFAPGTRWAYGMGLDVLGGVLAAIEGTSLETAVAKYVTGPLGMIDTHFHVSDQSRLAVPYADGLPPLRMAEPEYVTWPEGVVSIFSPARIFNSGAPQSGGSGMAGTATDVLTLLETFQPTGKFLQPETRSLALMDHTGSVPGQDPGRGFSLIGATLLDPKAAASPCSMGANDWGGVWGLSWYLDPIRRITSLVCTNTALEGCVGAFPTEIRNAIFAEYLE